MEYDEESSNRKASEKYHVAVKRLENGGKTNWKYLNQQLNQRIKDWKVVGEKH